MSLCERESRVLVDHTAYEQWAPEAEVTRKSDTFFGVCAGVTEGEQLSLKWDLGD